MQLEPKGSGSRLLFFRVCICKIWASRVDKQRENGRRGQHFMQQLQSLRSYRHVPSGDAGEVTAWSVQTCDKSKFNRIEPDVKHGWNCGGSRLSRQCSRGAGGHGNDGHFAPNQLGHYCGKPLVVTLRPAIFNRHVPTVDVTAFTQALVKGGQSEGITLSRPGADVSDHRHCRPLRTRRERPRCRTAKQRDELAPSQPVKMHAVPASLSRIAG